MPRLRTLRAVIKELRDLDEGKTPLYIGLFLDKHSHETLIRWASEEGPVLPKVIAHHVTIKFKPTPEELDSLPVGEPASVRVVGYASDPKAQAVVVDGLKVRTGAIPHVTVATATGVSPVYSQELLANGYDTVRGPVLTGTIQVEYSK
jgi:hypothetical protein